MPAEREEDRVAEQGTHATHDDRRWKADEAKVHDHTGQDERPVVLDCRADEHCERTETDEELLHRFILARARWSGRMSSARAEARFGRNGSSAYFFISRSDEAGGCVPRARQCAETPAGWVAPGPWIARAWPDATAAAPGPAVAQEYRMVRRRLGGDATAAFFASRSCGRAKTPKQGDSR